MRQYGFFSILAILNRKCLNLQQKRVDSDANIFAKELKYWLQYKGQLEINQYEDRTIVSKLAKPSSSHKIFLISIPNWSVFKYNNICSQSQPNFSRELVQMTMEFMAFFHFSVYGFLCSVPFPDFSLWILASFRIFAPEKLGLAHG